MTVRKYSSVSQQTTLSNNITSTATSIPVVSATTLLGGITLAANEAFTVVIKNGLWMLGIKTPEKM